jgi:hypothetical protein
MRSGAARPGGYSEVTVSNRIRVAALLVALVATAWVLGACGSSSKSNASSNTTAPSGQNGFAAYTDCLRRNGVTLPTAFPRGNRPSGRPTARPTNRPTVRPSGGNRGGGSGSGFGNQPPAGVDAQTWQKAQQACSSLRPTGNPQNRNNGAFTAYRNCLADHGVTMSSGPGQLDSNDPKVAAALKTCEPLRPTARPAPSANG